MLFQTSTKHFSDVCMGCVPLSTEIPVPWCCSQGFRLSSVPSTAWDALLHSRGAARQPGLPRVLPLARSHSLASPEALLVPARCCSASVHNALGKRGQVTDKGQVTDRGMGD